MSNTSLEERYVREEMKEYTITEELYGSSAAQIFVVKHQGELKVLKIACTKGIDNGNEKLRGEIKFFENLPSAIKDKFVPVYDYNLLGETVWYTMPFFEEYTTLKDYILREDSCYHIVDTIMDFMFKDLYVKHSSFKELNDHNLTRVTKRMEESIALDKSFQNIIEAKHIYINNILHMNFGEVLGILTMKFPQIFRGTFATLTHKDIAIENILIAKDLSDFKLIDPRGPGRESDYGDYIYDLAKYTYSLNGFTSIKDKEFSLEEREYFEFSFHMNKDFQTNYDKVYVASMSFIEEKVLRYFEFDKYWKERLRLTEAINFLATVPCFLYKAEQRNMALALYLQGTHLLNSLLNDMQQTLIK